MAKNRFLIAPITKGLQKDVTPFLLPEDAFAELNNAYIFRGTVKKRFGSALINETGAVGMEQLTSRLRVNIGTTDGAGNLVATVVPGADYTRIGQAFSVGTEMFTVITLIAPFNMISTGAGAGTFDTTTGTVTINGAAINTVVYYYPALPVMGLTTFERPNLNDEQTVAFDTQFAYYYTVNGWERLGAGVAVTWTGINDQFFWSINYRGITAYENYMFTTNFNTADRTRYWDGVNWTIYTPPYDANPLHLILSSRIILSFKNRLLFFNTVEVTAAGNQSFGNRLRYSQNGSPFELVAGQLIAFNESVPGRGGYIDAPTTQDIVSAYMLKDRLIVFCERSTWEIVYTGNEILPFIWQQINSELGVESSFSIVPFDKALIGVGNTGIHSCNGINVERIDDKIPDEVFQIHNINSGVFRVHGIRDYYTEMVYWTFPDNTRDANYPFCNKVLVYNYQNGTWAFNDDSFTCFGYLQLDLSEVWGTAFLPWEEALWPWDSAELQAKTRQIAAGNQEGFVSLIIRDKTKNSGNLQITNATIHVAPGNAVETFTVMNHNLRVNDFVYIENSVGSTEYNDKIFEILDTPTPNTFTALVPACVNPYIGGGTITRVSRISILTKEYNFYQKEGRNAAISKIDFLVDKTANGGLLVDFYSSSGNLAMTEQGYTTNSILGSNILETFALPLAPLEDTQVRLWHSVFTQAEGETIQLRLLFDDDMMLQPLVVFADFRLHAMIFYATPTVMLR